MTAIVIVMVMIVVVALVVLSVFADHEEDDWTSRRPRRDGPGDDGLDDLLDE
jgi:hypothetical protein